MRLRAGSDGHGGAVLRLGLQDVAHDGTDIAMEQRALTSYCDGDSAPVGFAPLEDLLPVCFNFSSSLTFFWFLGLMTDEPIMRICGVGADDRKFSPFFSASALAIYYLWTFPRSYCTVYNEIIHDQLHKREGHTHTCLGTLPTVKDLYLLLQQKPSSLIYSINSQELPRYSYRTVIAVARRSLTC